MVINLSMNETMALIREHANSVVILSHDSGAVISHVTDNEKLKAFKESCGRIVELCDEKMVTV